MILRAPDFLPVLLQIPRLLPAINGVAAYREQNHSLLPSLSRKLPT